MYLFETKVLSRIWKTILDNVENIKLIPYILIMEHYNMFL